MTTATRALTIIAEIADREKLADRLIDIEADLDGNRWFRPSALEHTHFTRFVILDDDGEHPDNALAPVLAWEVNYDGDEAAYLAHALGLSQSLDRIFECCLDYPTESAAKLAWLRAHCHRAAAFYCAYPGVQHEEIHNDIDVHAKLRELADDPEVWLLQKREIHQRFRDDLGATQLAITPVPDKSFFVARLLAVLAAFVIVWPLIVLVIVWWYPVLFVRERREGANPLDKPVHDNGLAEVEDKIRQNQLTHIVDIKPGRFRMFTLWLVLQVIGAMASKFYVNGHLGGITSIHLARWVIVRDRRPVPRAKRRDRLLFFSNYDGSWESYLGEFIDRASMGLTAIWSNTEGFPKTSNLIFAGARDEERFKQWTRDHQRVTQVWWSGVPLSSVQNVRDDVWLRRRVQENLSDEELQTWLRKV